MKVINEKAIWYVYLISIVALEAYTLISSDKGFKWALVSLLFVASATFIIHGYIFRKAIRMGGFSVNSNQTEMRLFCLFIAALWLFINFNFMLYGNVQGS